MIPRSSTKKKWSDISENKKSTFGHWKQQTSPWPIYRAQLERIKNQSDDMILNAQKLRQIARQYGSISRVVFDAIELIAKHFKDIEIEIQKLVEWLAGKDAESIKQVVNYTKKIPIDINFEDIQNDVLKELKTQFDLLPDKQTFYVDTSGGLLVELDLDVRKRSVSWLESEILTLMIEIYEITNQAHQSFTFCLANIRNRALLFSEGRTDHLAASDCILIANEQAIKLTKSNKEIDALSNSIERKLTQSFYITNIYRKDHPYLPISIQNTLRKFHLGRSRMSRGISSRWSKTVNWFRNIIVRVEKEEETSTLQKIVRYIDQRQPDSKNHHYTSIFLNKGFVGTSFAVGRIKEFQILEATLKEWEKGYRGSVLLSGPRFCGKTFFGEWATSRFFPAKKIIRINPWADIYYGGRKLKSEYSLSEVLDFVKKYALKDRPYLWLDNIELWQDENNTLFQNLDTLLKFVDLHSDKCFFLVSIGSGGLKHFSNQLDFKRTFQATINLDTIDSDEIYKAILIRHGATYRKILTSDGDEITSHEYKSMINKIIKLSNNNIGEVFQWWSSSVKYLNEKEVEVSPFEPYLFPLELSEEQRLLLRQIALFRKTDEYMLSRQFGMAFNQKYVFHLRRMLTNGMLSRLPEGSLEMKDCFANIVGNHIFEN
ncbi:MAG: hypothetical protein IPL46_05685 [Saprospiraceae bacterium]|nr:hypothetical protein [Saprospiraceae bacterium]